MLSEKKLRVSIGSLQKNLCMHVHTVYTQIQKIRKYLYGHFWVLGDMCFFFLHFHCLIFLYKKLMYYLYDTKKVKKKRILHVNPECATINLYDSQQASGTISLRAPLLWGVNANLVLPRQEYLFTLRNCQRKQSPLWNLRVFLKASSKCTRLSRLISPPSYNLTRLAFPFDHGWSGAGWHLGPWYREKPGGVRRSSLVPMGPPPLAYWERRAGETPQDRLPRRPFYDYRTTLCFWSKGLVRLKCGMRRKKMMWVDILEVF